MNTSIERQLLKRRTDVFRRGSRVCNQFKAPTQSGRKSPDNQIKQRTPLLRPKLRLPYRELQALAAL